MLTYNFQRWFTFIEPFLSPPFPFTDNQIFNQIRSLANLLPPIPAAGFETFLAQSKQRTDFILCASSAHGSQQILGNKRSAYHLSHSFSDHPIWKKIHELCATWQQPHSLLSQYFSHLWLEFDLHQTLPTIPIPGIYATIRRKNTRNTNLKHAYFMNLAQLSLKHFNQELTDGARIKLVQCLDKLPAHALVLHYGTMLSRKTGTIKLVFKDLKPTETLEYLKHIKWPGDLKSLKNLLSSLSQKVHKINYMLEIGDQIKPILGLECSFKESKKQNLIFWNNFLDYLIEQKLCFDQEKKTLLNWPGIIRAHGDNWPYETIPHSDKMQIYFDSALIRILSHVKIVYREGEPLLAKAYYGFIHRWIKK